jgi:hypothetical protein
LKEKDDPMDWERSYTDDAKYRRQEEDLYGFLMLTMEDLSR